MRYLLTVMLVLCLVSTAGAVEWRLSNLAPDKDTFVGEGGYDGREGGEGFGDAVAIGSLPYSDTGGTCDNTNDITLGCAASNAPDVVYSYTAGANEFVLVSLCGSSYDTALGVYDAGYVELYCNDDACGLQSEIEFAAMAGETYYFVIDGFSTSCGDYMINVSTSGGPCDWNCPDGALLEGEPDCYDDYVDNYNGGCNSTPYVFSLVCPQEGDMAVVCGTAGDYYFQGGQYRDTDWYRVYGTGGVMTQTVCASFGFMMAFMYGADCANLQYDYAYGAPGEAVSLSRTVAEGQEVWMFVATDFSFPPCGSPYVMTMEGIGNFGDCEPTAAEETTIGQIKSLYK